MMPLGCARLAIFPKPMSGSKVTLVATPPQLVREGMLRPFPSTPTQFQVARFPAMEAINEQS